MKPFRFLTYYLTIFVWLIAMVFSSFGQTEAATPTLAARDRGVFLFARQDDHSDKIAELEKGEVVTPLAHAVGATSWYLVKTQKGAVGWVKASEITPSEQTKETFREESYSTWSARSGNDRTFEGTWTVAPGPSPDTASGSWTLRDKMGKIVFSGTWSAQKFSTGWNGVWRARRENQESEYGGSWVADFQHGPDGRLSELFEAAAREVIRGIWSAGDHYGSWSFRAAK